MKKLPVHIAIVPDGNRRWAKAHGVPPLEGHKRGAEAMHNVVENLITRGVRYLTVWGFSTDNWKRSQEEIASIFQLLANWIEKDTPWLNNEGVRLRHTGRIVPYSLQRVIAHAVCITSNNTGMTLNLAFNYSGRVDIIDAVRRFIAKGDTPRLVDEALLSRYLYTDGMPDVDLIIRTAGQFRLSNFMLWQAAYSEIFFTEVLWPDFDETELVRALEVYAERQRTFGGD